MQVVVYAIRDLAIEATLNLLDYSNVIKIIDMELSVVKSRWSVIRTIGKAEYIHLYSTGFLKFWYANY